MKYRSNAREYVGRLHFGLLASLMLLVSCHEEKITTPSPGIRKIMSVTASSASYLASVDEDGGSEVTSRGAVRATSTGPTLDNNEGMNTDSSADGYFNISLTGLTPEYSEEKVFKTLMEYIFDVENNKYKVIPIGNQVWMAENLRTGHYSDGSEIPYAETSSEWAVDIDDKAYCW